MSGATDRAAIEALARELDDAGWMLAFAIAEHGRAAPGAPEDAVPKARALLAFLDEAWAGLSDTMRAKLPEERTYRDCTSNTRGTLCALARRHMGRAWQPYCVGGGRSPMAWKLSPLGRAVLKRAKAVAE